MPDIRIDGDGPEVLLMLHGWPDSASLWEPQVAHWRHRFRCVRPTWPGYGPGSADAPPRGCPLAEVMQHLAALADRVSPDRPLTLMTHDWGAFYGWEFARRHPGRVARIVAIDVGDAHSAEFRRELRAGGVAMIAFYQLWLALAWRLAWRPGGRRASGPARRTADRMTRWMASRLGWRGDLAQVHAGMNYPYDITWTGSHGGYRGLPPLEPHCPVFYAYGTRKPVQFQSRAWLARIAARPGNQVLAFDCGHWVMRSREEAFHQAVDRWLAIG